MTTIINDVKFAIRQLRNSPGFTAVSVFTLALCIGANVTIFAMVDTILVRPCPFRRRIDWSLRLRPIREPVVNATAYLS